MDDNASPALEVGFIINPAGSDLELERLQELMGSTEMKVVREAANIERATRGMVDLSGATASLTVFGNASTRELQNAVRESSRVEKAGERLVAQLERQNAAYGKTRSELRQMKAEELALAAIRTGNAELAERIRAAEQVAWGNEYATARRAQAEQEALQQDREAAIAQREREAEAIREAAAAERMFETVARQRMQAYREEQALLAAAEREVRIARERADAEAAINAQLLERARLEMALERTTGVGRIKATDAGATFSALDARAAEDEARATAVAAAEKKKLADETARLAAQVRGSYDAQMADAAAGERLREITDPLYAATKRVNEQIAESTRLYHAGATAKAEYERQQEVLTGRLNTLGQAHDELTKRVGKNGYIMTQFSFQLNDVATMAAMGAKPMQIFASQAGQIFQLAQMAEGGVKGFAAQVGELLLRFTPLIATTAVAGVALYRWNQQLNDDAGIKKFVDGLGLTHKELKKLDDQSVTTGDMIAGLWKTISDGAGLGGTGKSLLDYLFSPGDAKQVETFVAQVYGVFLGGYDAIVALWKGVSGAISGAVSGAAAAAAGFFKPVTDAAFAVWQSVSGIFNKLYDMVAGWLKGLGGWIAPVLKALGMYDASATVSTAGDKIGSAFGNAYTARVKQAMSGMDGFIATTGKNAVAHAQQRLTTDADKIKADRSPKTDRHAEQLAREAEATEAQIRNLYKLADAYKVSDAAALIAEARVKVESQAIKQRGDIEAAVDRQVRLSIAQRVSDGEKAAGNLRTQAGVQEGVNAAIAAGLVPAERAAELLRDRIALLPLQAALEAAVLRGQAGKAAEAGKVIMDLTAAQERDNAARREALFLADKQAGTNQIAQLQLEAQMIGATDEARVHALATLKATQEAQAKFTDPAQQAAYISQQVQIADQATRNRLAQDAYNGSLEITADKWEIIAGKVQSAARGMADAFGQAGRAIGDMASIYANFSASRTRAEAEHERVIRAAGTNEALIAQENARFALRSSGAQIEAYGDMAAAAKGFFKEGSAGYKAMAAAEKVYRIAQLAMSLQSMVQMALETTARTSAAAAQATAEGTAGIAKQSQLPFPANIAAMAATAAALVAAGVAVFGGHGGGHTAADYTRGNTGTGTVLGDPTKASESIKNAIDLLKSVDDATLTVSRNMLASLRSIESNIGGLASLLVRTGNLSADNLVNQGFNNSTGKTTGAVVGGAIGAAGGTIFGPVGMIVGSVIGSTIGKLIGSLFGTKTKVVGSGLYGGAQTLGDVLNGGYDLQTYSDLQKKKKLFGITTSTKYSTVYGQADDSISDQFTLVLRSFYTAISQAAGPLSQATGDIEQRLQGFVFDLGKIQLDGKTGDEIKELLTNALGAAADDMAKAAVPGLERFQAVGEGYFQTLVRVASTVEQVDATFQKLGRTAGSLGIDVDMAIAGMFDSVSDFTSLADSYFGDYYTKGEQAAAITGQITRALGTLGLQMPDTLAGFRSLVEAQDLTTDAGRSTYVTLLQLAPAFSNLKTSLEGAKSAADILSEREDLNTKLLQLTGDTAALRAAELAKLDPSNRALQQQIYAIQDAQDAAKAASDLRDAWKSVGDTIMDEVNRIRGLTDPTGTGGYAQLLGRFNATTSAARGGDQDAAKLLPGLSQSLLAAAKDAATSRQELDRIQAQTAASLEQTYGVVMAAAMASTGSSATIDAAATAAGSSSNGPSAANDDAAAEVAALRGEIAQLRTDLVKAVAAVASNTGSIDKRLDRVTAAAQGSAIAIVDGAEAEAA